MNESKLIVLENSGKPEMADCGCTKPKSESMLDKGMSTYRGQSWYQGYKTEYTKSWGFLHGNVDTKLLQEEGGHDILIENIIFCSVAKMKIISTKKKLKW